MKDDDSGLPPSQQPVNASIINEIRRDVEEEDDFNWSIDQIAVLQPCEFSYDAEFNQEMTQYYDSSMEVEDEEFFNQLEIIPSPLQTIPSRPQLRTPLSMSSSSRMQMSINCSPIVQSGKKGNYSTYIESPFQASSFFSPNDKLRTPKANSSPLQFSTPVPSNILFSNDDEDIFGGNSEACKLVSSGLRWKDIEHLPAMTPCSTALPKYTSTPGLNLSPYDYQPCTPPPSQSTQSSSSSILTPNLTFKKSRHKKKLFCDN